MVSLNISSPPFASTLGFVALPYSPPPKFTGALPWPAAAERIASFTEAPGEAMVNGDFLGGAGAGDSSCAVAGGVGCTAGTGAAVCAVAGFCCIACWPGGGGREALGGPGLRASISLRNVSLSTVGVLVCAMRFLSEVMLVLGGFTLSRSSGNGMNVVSCFSLMGTMTGRLKFHFGIKINKAMMTACVIREIHAASRRR